jgi:hypothetical protein
MECPVCHADDHLECSFLGLRILACPEGPVTIGDDWYMARDVVYPLNETPCHR